jgi:hypothetical protein
LVDKILTRKSVADYAENKVKLTQVSEYDLEIDGLVYELYGLTVEEIKIV